jgi:hypothetical protein
VSVDDRCCGRCCLISYEFILKGHTASKEMYIKIFHRLRDAVKRKQSECQESHSKKNKSTDKGIEKWFPGMLPKALQTLARVSQPKETTLKAVLCK